jgi:transposase
VWYKRLEKQRFKWPRQCESGYELRDGRDLNFLLDGLDIWRNKPHEILYFDSVS